VPLLCACWVKLSSCDLPICAQTSRGLTATQKLLGAYQLLLTYIEKPQRDTLQPLEQ
jgi:hypothetical protein